jgi:hypothetical protein
VERAAVVVKVEFEWANQFGFCEDCGDLPANYFAPDLVVTHCESGKAPVVQTGQKLCPICAALHASYGERLERLWKDEEEDHADV